ncbi:MAG: glutaredoxin [Myxococcales bacterium]|nr:glutaredoxin [Myxococcales bacterium]MCB9748978.1 glutaredoxin [Myxococcales bacterium]
MTEEPDIGVPRPAELEEPVVIYTRPLCVYCTLALRLLRARHVPFREVCVSRNTRARAWLLDASGQHTVPQVFIRGRSVGGYTELAALDRAGGLAGL